MLKWKIYIINLLENAWKDWDSLQKVNIKKGK